MESINTNTGETIATYDEHTSEEGAAIVSRAQETFQSWRRTSFAERADLLRAAADLLESRKEELAQLMAAEMGKPIAGGRGEVDKTSDHAAKGLRLAAEADL